MFQSLLDFLTARRMTIAEESMVPNLRPGDRVVFSRKALRKEGLRRGHIVLVRAPGAAGVAGFGLGSGPDAHAGRGGGKVAARSRGRLDVKRVVGLPGETIEVRGSGVIVNGRVLDEPYLPTWVSSKPPPLEGGGEGAGETWTLGPDQYFLLADNRGHPGAVDSRRYGPIKRDRLAGLLVRRF